MNLKASLKAITPLLLSIFLTAVNVSAQLNPQPSISLQIDRRAYVEAAFEELLPTLNFLAGSDKFKNQLSSEELRQFYILGNYFIKHQIKISPLPQPSDKRTSKLIDFKLRFSDRHEDFQLIPGQPERTAKVTDDVWFNLNIINNPSNKFGLLDALQILIHEFAHKLNDQVNPEILDIVAAKTNTFLSAYHKESVLSNNLKTSTLVLPYLISEDHPVDLQAEPIVIIENAGQASQVRVDVTSIASPSQKYTSFKTDLQTFTRVSLNPEFSNYQNGVLISWSVETKNILINSQYFNYLDLYSNTEKTKPLQPLDPILEYKSFYQYIPPESLKLPVPIQLKNWAESIQPYSPSPDSKWMEKLEFKSTLKEMDILEGVVESTEELKDILILAQHKNDIIQFPGEITKLNQIHYKISFQIPKNVSEMGSLFLKSIVLNMNKQWDLDQVIKIETTPITKQGKIKAASIEIWNNDRWESIDQMTAATTDTEEIKMRFTLTGTTNELSHMETSWITQEEIYKEDTKVGFRIRNLYEVIPNNKIKQMSSNGNLIVEFKAKKISTVQHQNQTKNNFSLKDTGLRGLINIQFVDKNLNVFATGSRLTQNGWKSAFILKSKIQPNVFSCQKIF